MCKDNGHSTHFYHPCTNGSSVINIKQSIIHEVTSKVNLIIYTKPRYFNLGVKRKTVKTGLTITPSPRESSFSP